MPSVAPNISTSGEPAWEVISRFAPSDSDDNGHYSIPVPQHSEYRIFFDFGYEESAEGRLELDVDDTAGNTYDTWSAWMLDGGRQNSDYENGGFPVAQWSLESAGGDITGILDIHNKTGTTMVIDSILSGERGVSNIVNRGQMSTNGDPQNEITNLKLTGSNTDNFRIAGTLLGRM